MQSPRAGLQIVSIHLDGELELLAQVHPLRSQVRHDLERQHAAHVLQVQLDLSRELQEVRHEPKEVGSVDFEVRIRQYLGVQSSNQRVVALQKKINRELFQHVGYIVVGRRAVR